MNVGALPVIEKGVGVSLMSNVPSPLPVRYNNPTIPGPPSVYLPVANKSILPSRFKSRAVTWSYHVLVVVP